METIIVPHASVGDLSATKVLQMLLQTSGNIALTAERLKCKPADILTVLIAEANSIDILKQQIQLMTLVKLYEILQLTADAYKVSLADMDPRDISKSLNNLSSQLLTALPSQPQAMDPVQAVLALLPADVKKALQDVVDGQQQLTDSGALSEHTTDTPTSDGSAIC